MANTQQNNINNAKIQGLLARYLELRSKESLQDQRTGHLDEDTINTLVEGRLTEREATPVVAHLTDCSFCRHKTVELVRLEMYFEGVEEPFRLHEESPQPVSVSSVLGGILNRIFGSGEAAVFAHEEKKDEKDEPAAAGDEKEPKQ
jgi:hypothetical protein